MNENDDVTTPEERESDLWTVTEPGVPLFMNNTLTIKPERRKEFLAALREVLPAARAEPACLYLHVGESVAEPGVFVLSEGWKDLVEYRDVILRKPTSRPTCRSARAPTPGPASSYRSVRSTRAVDGPEARAR